MLNIPSAAKAALTCVEVTSVRPEGRTLQSIKYQNLKTTAQFICNDSVCVLLFCRSVT